MSNLSPQQFPEDSPHGPGWYQRPLPGMEQMGADPKLPVRTLFRPTKHEWGPPSTGDQYYFLTRNYHPEIRDVKTTSLRPTQPHVDEGYLYKEPEVPLHVKRLRGTGFDRIADEEMMPTVLRHKGKNYVQDGHHRVARALLSGEKRMKVRVWDPETML